MIEICASFSCFSVGMPDGSADSRQNKAEVLRLLMCGSDTSPGQQIREDKK